MTSTVSKNKKYSALGLALAACLWAGSAQADVAPSCKCDTGATAQTLSPWTYVAGLGAPMLVFGLLMLRKRDDE